MNDTPAEIMQSNDFIVLEDIIADEHDESVILDENTIILAAGDAYSIINMKKMTAALKASGKSYQDIAFEKDISVSSIYKFFARKSKNPSFYNFVMICDSIGISIDDVCDLKCEKIKEDRDSLVDEMKSRMTRMQNTIDGLYAQIQELLSEIKRITPANRDDY
jgi:transcriptional regulator with XRE-family HTH domain